jgi:hypothetical protein
MSTFESVLERIKACSIEQQDRIFGEVYTSRHLPKKRPVKSQKRIAWNEEVTRVWNELKKENSSVKRSVAMAEAGRRRKDGSEVASVMSENSSSSGSSSSYSVEYYSGLTKDEIKERDMFKYYVGVQKSGSSKLLSLATDPYFMQRFGLNETSAHEVVMSIIENYDSLAKKYCD